MSSKKPKIKASPTAQAPAPSGAEPLRGGTSPNKVVDSQEVNAINKGTATDPEDEEAALEAEEATGMMISFTDLVIREIRILHENRKSFLAHGINPYVRALSRLSLFHKNFAEIASQKGIKTD